MTNAERFLNAYNSIDHSLRNQYNFKRAMAFTDMIRRCVIINSVVRKYEDDLIDYSRLRNAIVHSGNESDIIAEPHTNVVEKLEHIAKLICTPPRAVDSICKKDVLVVNARDTVKSVVETISKSGYSNLPVYENDKLIGIANGQRLLDAIGKAMLNNRKIDEFCKTITIGEIVSNQISDTYYALADENITLEQALNTFYRNRKVLVILITKNGSDFEKPLGIVSVADIMDINSILENY
ncbi:MAG TPA: hypothetical protein DCO89_00380 [Clostridiales bacterium]|nr:hypothetical protein [Clostridiales bacterium]